MNDFGRAARYFGKEFVIAYGDNCECPTPREIITMAVSSFRVKATAILLMRCRECGLQINARWEII